MKNRMLTLITSVSICAAGSALAMEEKEISTQLIFPRPDSALLTKTTPSKPSLASAQEGEKKTASSSQESSKSGSQSTSPREKGKDLAVEKQPYQREGASSPSWSRKNSQAHAYVPKDASRSQTTSSEGQPKTRREQKKESKAERPVHEEGLLLSPGHHSTVSEEFFRSDYSHQLLTSSSNSFLDKQQRRNSSKRAVEKHKRSSQDKITLLQISGMTPEEENKLSKVERQKSKERPRSQSRTLKEEAEQPRQREAERRRLAEIDHKAEEERIQKEATEQAHKKMAQLRRAVMAEKESSGKVIIWGHSYDLENYAEDMYFKYFPYMSQRTKDFDVSFPVDPVTTLVYNHSLRVGKNANPTNYGKCKMFLKDYILTCEEYDDLDIHNYRDDLIVVSNQQTAKPRLISLSSIFAQPEYQYENEIPISQFIQDTGS